MITKEEDLESFLDSIDVATAHVLRDMGSKEDWVLSKDDPEYHALIKYMEGFLSKPDLSENSYLATQLLGWVSAPQCLMLIKDLSMKYPGLIRSIFLDENNNAITRMVVERLNMLECHMYLRRMLDPVAVRSIARGIRHYYKQHQDLIDA